MSDLLHYSRHYRVFPYQGQFPLTTFLGALQSTGYEGAYSLEVFNDEFRSSCPNEIALEGFRSMTYLQKHLDYTFDRLRPVAHGVEFVEFGCSFWERDALRRLLLDMGFQLIGKHKSKLMDIYGHGQCCIIINCETPPQKSALYLRNGSWVRSIGVRVSNVDTTAAWAKDLRYPVLLQDEYGVGEDALVAIRAPDESLIYLVDSATPAAFLSNFVLTSETPRSDGNLSFDYVSRVLSPRDLDKTILFYRSLFAFELSEKSDIVDPRGLVQAYSMVSKAGRLQLCLNISTSESTVVGRFISHCGPGIHYISLRTDDIFSALQTITKNVLLLPQNYFDDLHLRLRLSPEEVAKLNRENVMYDVDGDGEFLHACTDAFRGRFFFELVERRGQYSGYGVQNAAIRTVKLVLAVLTIIGRTAAQDVSRSACAGGESFVMWASHSLLCTCRILLVVVDNAILKHIHLRQCGGAIDTRIKGFGRLRLVLHRLCIVLECTLVSQFSLGVKGRVVALVASIKWVIQQHTSLWSPSQS